jgi:hypothetical protein
LSAATDDNPTRKHHLATYGRNVTYDDFFANWTASAWNPDDWTDLFADSGAKYFVLVTKHHDGVVLFDTNSTDRTSVKLGPKRNFLKELFESAKNRHPELHRGVRTFSLAFLSANHLVSDLFFFARYQNTYPNYSIRLTISYQNGLTLRTNLTGNRAFRGVLRSMSLLENAVIHT